MKNKITIAPRYYRWHVDKGVVWIEKNTSYAHLNWKIPLAQTALVLVDIWSHHYLKDTKARSEEIVHNKIVPLLSACRKAEMPIVHAPAPRLAEAHPSWVNLIEKGDSEGKDDWPPTAFRSKTGTYEHYARPIEPREEELTKTRARLAMHPLVQVEGQGSRHLHGRRTPPLVQTTGHTLPLLSRLQHQRLHLDERLRNPRNGPPRI